MTQDADLSWNNFWTPTALLCSLPTRANIVRWSRDSRYLFLLGVCVYLVDSESESILRTLCGKTVTGGTFKSGIWKNLSPVTVYPLWIASSSQRLEFMRLPTHDYTLDKCTTTFCIHNFPRRTRKNAPHSSTRIMQGIPVLDLKFENLTEYERLQEMLPFATKRNMLTF